MIRRTLWKFCRLLYLYIGKPIFFSVPPDTAHNITIRFSIFVGKVRMFKWFVKLIFVKRRDVHLTQTYHGVEFVNPIGLSAGFDKNGQVVPTIAALGFGFAEIGSVTARRCAGNPRPWFYRLPKTKSMVVNAGLANDGSRTVIKRLNQIGSNIGQFPIILSVAKTNSDKVVSIKEGIADYITTIKRAKNQKVIKMIELNVSCPNAFGGEPFTTPIHLERLLNAVDKVGVTQPIYVKMPVDLSWDAFRDLLDVIIKHRVSGVTIANLAKNRNTIGFKDFLPDKIPGNLSGKPTWQSSNELIRRTYLSYGDKLTIIGAGGIFSAKDAYAKIRLGASLVELLTGMIFNGPQLAAEISDGLLRLIERDGFTHINQVIGIDVKK